MKRDADNIDVALRENERQQALLDRADELTAKMEQKLDADRSLNDRFKKLSEPVFDDPAYAKANARFKRAMEENHPETARGLVLEMNDIAEAKPERQEAYELVPEFKEIKEIEKQLSARPHPIQECLNYREDYFECLHGMKFKARLYEMGRVARLKAKGQWPPPGNVADSGGH